MYLTTSAKTIRPLLKDKISLNAAGKAGRPSQALATYTALKDLRTCLYRVLRLCLSYLITGLDGMRLVGIRHLSSGLVRPCHLALKMIES